MPKAETKTVVAALDTKTGTLEFEAAMKKNGAPVWLQKFPGAGHGGGSFGKPSIILLMKNFFDKYLQDADVKIELVPEAELAQEPPKQRKSK